MTTLTKYSIIAVKAETIANNPGLEHFRGKHGRIVHISPTLGSYVIYWPHFSGTHTFAPSEIEAVKGGTI